jgi:predicted nucleic acid-binding protein
MIMRVAIDTSVLVGLINSYDLWRNQAFALRQALQTAGAELVYFDCVASEAISAAARRFQEKKRMSEVETLFRQLGSQVPPETITWILSDVQRLYPEVLYLMESSGGVLNFNDALIALACRERDIPVIASFDADFDQISWLRRWAKPEDVNISK